MLTDDQLERRRRDERVAHGASRGWMCGMISSPGGATRVPQLPAQSRSCCLQHQGSHKLIPKNPEPLVGLSRRCLQKICAAPLALLAVLPTDGCRRGLPVVTPPALGLVVSQHSQSSDGLAKIVTIAKERLNLNKVTFHGRQLAFLAIVAIFVTV